MSSFDISLTSHSYVKFLTRQEKPSKSLELFLIDNESQNQKDIDNENQNQCLTYRNTDCCQDFWHFKKRRKIKGLIKVALKGRNKCVKTLCHCPKADVPVRNICARVCCVICGDVPALWARLCARVACVFRASGCRCVWHSVARGNLSRNLCEKKIKLLRLLWSILLFTCEKHVFSKDWHGICIWLI